jgi:hypothetical protein
MQPRRKCFTQQKSVKISTFLRKGTRKRRHPKSIRVHIAYYSWWQPQELVWGRGWMLGLLAEICNGNPSD